MIIIIIKTTVVIYNVIQISKDFEVTFSFLYHFIKNVIFNKIDKVIRLIIYMDNCPGTNKNNYALMIFNYLVNYE